MLNYLNPKNFIQVINKIQRYIFILFLIVLSIGLIEALVLSPEDYKQSDSVRIMYVHVPAAWISLGIFSVISLMSFWNLIFKK
jgi:ABC-type transport system involved in cytochrome c biogenesis, permease component